MAFLFIFTLVNILFYNLPLSGLFWICRLYNFTARCGGWINAQNATLTSPGYPFATDSAGGIECSWTIEVPRGHYIELTFTAVSIENPVNGQCRRNNFVEIRDYNETGASCFILIRTFRYYTINVKTVTDGVKTQIKCHAYRNLTLT